MEHTALVSCMSYVTGRTTNPAKTLILILHNGSYIIYLFSSAGGRICRACSSATSSNVSSLACSRVWSAASIHRGKECEHSWKLRFVWLNVGTLKKTAKMIETVSRRTINLRCLQETGFSGVFFCRTIIGYSMLKTLIASSPGWVTKRKKTVYVSYWLNAGWRM